MCPNGVFEVRDPTNEELLSQVAKTAQAGKSVYFACPVYLQGVGERKGAEGLVVVDCLGRLDESILVGAVAAGATTVWLIDGSCQGCTGAEGHTVARKVVRSANLLLEGFGTPEAILMRGELPSRPEAAYRPEQANGEPSRRAFFGRVAAETTRAAAVVIDAALDGAAAEATEIGPPRRGELPVRLPVKRRLLLAALKRLGEPISGAVEVGEGPFAQFRIKESCTGCQMCAFFCPTGALRKVVLEGQAGLAFRLAHCTNCRLCQEICYWDAVYLSPLIQRAKLVDETEDTLLVPRAAAPTVRLP